MREHGCERERSWNERYLWEQGTVVVQEEGQMVVDQVIARDTEVNRVPMQELGAHALKELTRNGR